VVYAGTRQVYGKPRTLPVDESHPVAPVDFNGVLKHKTELYHLMLSRDGLLDAVVLGLTNVYGPRLAINAPCQGVLSTFFLNLAIGKPVEVFGDGTQLRDPLYVDDAVDAILRAGAEKPLRAKIYNVGGGQALMLAEIARTLCRLAEAPPPRFRPFPPERAMIDIGGFMTDSTLIRQHLGWAPATSFEDGATSTVRFLRARLRDYLDPMAPDPSCVLHRQHYLTRKAGSEC
jgi:UDP-glucose 4-epimerase